MYDQPKSSPHITADFTVGGNDRRKWVVHKSENIRLPRKPNTCHPTFITWVIGMAPHTVWELDLGVMTIALTIDMSIASLKFIGLRTLVTVGLTS